MKSASVGLVVECVILAQFLRIHQKMGKVTRQPGFLQGCGVQDRSTGLLAPSVCAAASAVSRQQAVSQAGSNFLLP